MSVATPDGCALRQAAMAVLIGLVVVAGVEAVNTRFLKRNETFCDTSRTLCLHGTIDYRFNSRVLAIKARVQKSAGPGTIRLRFTGSSRIEVVGRTEMTIATRGRYSEIVQHKIRPDDPSVADWQLAGFFFEPDQSKQRTTR